MSRKGLSDKELERLLNESSDSEAEDNVEHEIFDDESDDFEDNIQAHSVAQEVEDSLERDLVNVWGQTDMSEPGPSKRICRQKSPSQPGPSKARDVTEPVSERTTSAQMSSKTLNELIVISEKNKFVGRNNCEWNSTVYKYQSKTPNINIIHIRPGPVANVRNVISPLDIFQVFFIDKILNKIVLHTNQEITRVKTNYKIQSQTIQETNLDELKALLGIYILAAVLKDNHLSANIMFDTTFCGTRYRATMSQKRFEFLTRCLRFDDKTTREARRNINKFAPISEIWEEFIEICRSSYKPGSYVTIDEQLVGFRGRCPFRMYIPNKPAKYGIKIVALCDVATKYLIDAYPYTGKSMDTCGRPLADYSVETLTRTIYGSSRNVTMDNWFTSVPLAEKLIQRPYKLTVVGTIRKNKPHIPPDFLENNKSRKPGTSMFAYRENVTLVSYKPNKNRNVLLISSMHLTGTINPVSRKPEIIEAYNSTKGAVDTFDQMCQNMSCNRKTKRWPLCFFYNMINMACINSYVMYTHNMISSGKRPLSRTKFMLELHEKLTRPWQSNRLARGSNLSRELKNIIEDVLGEKPGNLNVEVTQKGPRKYCHICPSALKRMTTTYCLKCAKPICGEHQRKICPQC